MTSAGPTSPGQERSRRGPTGDVVAAGAVVLEHDRVLLVHRPRYDDWGFPKGKLDRGESAPAAAVREVAEESGVGIRLGAPVSVQRYRLASGRDKVVHYWIGRPVGAHDVRAYPANREIDRVRWVPLDKAYRRLTYDVDRETLERALERRTKTRALVVLRHARARSRSRWKGEDALRPLLATGEAQARRLAPVLAAYGVREMVTSDSRRCAATLAPYAEQRGLSLRPTSALSEQGATTDVVWETVDELLTQRRDAVVCTHRPVLPLVCDALGLDPVPLEPGGLLVVHHRRGRVLAQETPFGG